MVEEEPTATKENEEMLTKEDEEETTTKQDEEAAAEEDEEVLIADKVDERNTNNTENKENRLTAWSKLITRTVGLEQVVSTIPHVDCQKMGSVHCWFMPEQINMANTYRSQQNCITWYMSLCYFFT